MRKARALTVLGTLVAGLALLLGTAGTAQAATATQPAASTLSVPVTGTIAGTGGTFSGTFTPTKFVSQNGALATVGTLTGTLTNAAGSTIGTVSQQVTQPTAVATATCDILTLTLGPLHLDLLGLVVDLNQVNLSITAQQGSGNLLGNLLCAVANLLNGTGGTGGLSGLTALLNQILAALGL